MEKVYYLLPLIEVFIHLKTLVMKENNLRRINIQEEIIFLIKNQILILNFQIKNIITSHIKGVIIDQNKRLLF